MKTTLLACLALALVLVYLSDYAEGYQVYVHWGRRGCPLLDFATVTSSDRRKRADIKKVLPVLPAAKARVIYYGVVAKSEWGAKGGGSEFICLREKPEWSRYKPGMQSVGKKCWNSRIYGTQFMQCDLYPELGTNINQYDHADVPCTLCETYVASHHAMMMMPASWNCPTNWNKQYAGYLMAEPSGKKKSQSNYICVNSYAGFIRNGDQTPHARLAYVEVGCHSSGLIPCSTYPNGRELTCVVCVR